LWGASTVGLRCTGRGWGRGTALSHDDVLLDAPNNSDAYNADNLIYEYLNEDDKYNDVININITSRYYDINSFISRFKNSKNPIILSLNIQSLQSKYNELK
jgi:hypothetical protein